MNKQGKSQFTETLQQALMFLGEVYKKETGKDPKLDLLGFGQFINLLLQKTGIKDVGLFLDTIYLLAQQQASNLQPPQQLLTLAARHGAKLNYVKALKNQCPEGQEPYYYKKGGMVKCGCTGKKLMEDGGEVKKENAVARFKKTITNKKSNLKEGIKKGAKTIADSAVKIAKEKLWSDEHKRIMKASGIHDSPTLDYVAGDKCGGKVKKHLFGGTFLNNIINLAKLKLYGKNMEYTSNTKYFPNSNIRVTRKISPVNPYVQDTTYIAETKVPNFEGIYNPIGLTSTYHGNNGDSPNILRLPYNNWKEMYEKSK